MKRTTLQKKNVSEELDGIDIDDIGNFEALIRIVFSMQNVGILKYSLVVESLINILLKRRNQTFYKLIDVHSVTNVLCKNISVVSMWNILNQ